MLCFGKTLPVVFGIKVILNSQTFHLILHHFGEKRPSNDVNPKALAWNVEPKPCAALSLTHSFGSIENMYRGKACRFCTCEMFSSPVTHTFILGVVNHHSSRTLFIHILFQRLRIHIYTHHTYVHIQWALCGVRHTYIMFYSWCKVRFVVANDSSMTTESAAAVATATAVTTKICSNFKRRSK